MGEIQGGENLLFLTDEQLRQGIEAMFFAYRGFTADPDRILATMAYGRAHHRAIHFIARSPGTTVTNLLAILGVTKQSLNRVLRTLIEDGLVESRVGEGTAIALLVPPVQGAAGKRNAPVRDGIGSGNLLQGHIALVDDNPEVAEFMTDLLTSWGFDVSAHTDSLEARDLLLTEGGRFDLLLLDQTMPGITGIELAREVLRAHPELPVMLYTGHSDQIDEGSVAAVGVRALLRKPIDNARLRSLLVAHLHPG
jgi:CheY-like chemotaxis protein/DNA-binding transcriptional ArsR family regulator